MSTRRFSHLLGQPSVRDLSRYTPADGIALKQGCSVLVLLNEPRSCFGSPAPTIKTGTVHHWKGPSRLATQREL